MSGEKTPAGRDAVGPDLLIVGGQRCATTWLANVLRQHPAIWIPPIKELHYFDQQRGGTDRAAFRRRYLGHLKKRLKHNARRVLRLRAPCWWDFRYFLHRRSDRWYCSLFRGAKRKGLLAGEATPAYALESEETYRLLRQWNPDLRVILIMREPVSRLWSAVNKWSRQTQRGQATMDQLIEKAEKSQVRAGSEYWRTIDRLERVFDRDRIFYGFYDDLSDAPAEFLSAVLRFLNVDDSTASEIVSREKQERQSGKPSVPGEFRRRMEPYFVNGVVCLCARFGGPPCRWQSEYETGPGSNE